MTAAHTSGPEFLPAGARRLPVIGYLALVAVYLVVLQGLPFLLPHSGSAAYGSFPDVASAARLVLTVGISVVLGVVAVSLLRWWRPVMRDDRPVRRWVWTIPIVMLVTILAGTNYGLISQKGAGLFFTLLLGCLLVGVGEELMYRGIGVVTFRSLGFSEGRVALWVAVIFGLSHATNIISEGAKSIIQVLVTMVAGYFFYLIRRVAGTLLVGMVLHGLWDFGLLSTAATGKAYAGTFLFILADIVLAIIILVRRHHIEPERAPHSTRRSLPVPPVRGPRRTP